MQPKPEEKMMVYREGSFDIDIGLAPLGLLVCLALLLGGIVLPLGSWSPGNALLGLLMVLLSGSILVVYVRNIRLLRGLVRHVAVSVTDGELKSWDHTGRLQRIAWDSIAEMRLAGWGLTLCWFVPEGAQQLKMGHPTAWRPGFSAWLVDEVTQRAGLDERREEWNWSLSAFGRQTVYRRAGGPGGCGPSDGSSGGGDN